MPNISKINGFRPVKHLSGSPWMGNANIYYVSSAGADMGVGDVVKLGSTSSASGIQTVALAAAGDAVVGVVVGVINSKLDPVTGAMTSGSISLDTPQYIASGGSGFVLVCDDPTVVYEVETSNGTPLATDVGLNINHAVTAFSTTRGISQQTIDFGTEAATATLTFKLLGFVQRPDNEIGASAKMLVKINNHQFQGHTGTAGV
jgi:hypothetical protein